LALISTMYARMGRSPGCLNGSGRDRDSLCDGL
jgi:hypothetical protein